MKPDPSDSHATTASRTRPPASRSRRQWLQLAGAGAMLHALPGCGSGGDDTPDAANLAPAIQWGRDAIAQAMQRTGTQAVTVALLTREGIVWQEAFGWANRETALAATPETRFNIGSVSKVLAALAVTILRDRGLLALDAPVIQYLPGFAMRSPGYRDITVRQLLSHASGLPGTNTRNIFAFSPLPGYAQDTEAGLAQFRLKHAPGALAVYCNDGFTLTERIVLALTGLPYPEFVRREILEPLDMRRSAYALAPFAEGSFAHPYLEGRRMPQEFVMGYATGGLSSTPGDMMKLAALFLDHGIHQGRRIVSEAGILDMGSDQTRALRINPSPEWRWGLGWDNVRQPGMAAAGVDAWQKNGGTAFYASDFFVLPQARMALFISGSGTAYNPGAIAEGVLLRALARTGAISMVPPAVSSTIPALSPSATPAAPLTGIYGNFNAPLRVSSPDGGSVDLHVWENGQWQAKAIGLRSRTDGWWWSDAQPQKSYRWERVQDTRYLIERQAGGAGHYRTTLPLGQQMLPRNQPLPAAWRARVGTRWRTVSESPDSIGLQLGGGVVTLGELPELPGYVLWDNAQFLLPEDSDRAGMCVQVPANHGRDLVDIRMERAGGQERLWVGTSRYEREA